MSIAPDPENNNNADSDDEFNSAFEAYAAGKAPEAKKEDEHGAPDGNGPEGQTQAPPADAAAAEGGQEEDATSGEAGPTGGEAPPAADDNQAPDPWAALPDELKAQVEQIVRERDEALHRASSDANRVSALSRKLRELSIGQAAAPPAAAQPNPAREALDAKIKQLKEDYGDIADPILELMEAQRNELNNVRTVLTGMSEAQQQAVIQHETQALEARHPDWRNIAQSPDFNGWLEIQPENIQRLANSWDARETSVVLTLFKAERAEAMGQQQQTASGQQQQQSNAATGERRSQQLDGGKAVWSKPAPAASGPPEDFDTAFEYFTQKRALAAQRG